MISLRLRTDERTWRGSNELLRESTVHHAQPVLRVFGKMVPVGREYVAVEVVHWPRKGR